MQAIEVGKLLQEDKTRYPEVPKFDFDQAGGVLFVFFKSPTQTEVDAFRSGDVKLGLFYKDGIIFLLFKFGSLHWMDVAYTCHLSQSFVFDHLEDDMGYGMTLVFTDADTGIVKVLKLIGWPNKMSQLFQTYVLDQRGKPFDHYEYNIKTNRIYKNYSTDDMVRMGQTFRLKERK
jgi:hypothetical protein